MKITYMIKKTATVIAVAALVALPFSAIQADSALALTQQEQRQAICEGTGGTADGDNCATGAIEPGVSETIKNVGNILVFITGAVSVLMVIIGGFRYTMSGGDQSQTKSAKDTIIYALIGIAVSFVAYALVNFVIVNLFD